MGKLDDCLDKATRAGALDATDIATVRKQVSAIERRLKIGGDLAPEQAGLLAEQQAVRNMAEQLAVEKRQKILQVMTLGRALENVKAHPRDIASGVMSLLTKDWRGEARYANVEYRGKAIEGLAHAKMAELIEAYRTKRLGFAQNQAGVRNMVRELLGTSTGDPDAKNYGKMWSDTAEWLRQRFNRAGGQIRKREDWGLPQHHDQVRIKHVGREQWKQDIREVIDPDRMVDENGLPIAPADLERALDKSYDRITTDGLVDLVPGRTGGSKLANRHTDARFFVFKDADSWLKYHDKYGSSDVFSTLMEHVSKMSHETALLEVLGPNPAHAVQYLSDVAQKSGAGPIELGYIKGVWNVVSGKVNGVGNVTIADFMGGTRHLLVSAKLGSAFLSSISDIAFGRITRGFNGLPSTKMIGNLLSQMNPANEADRLFAVKLGMVAEAGIRQLAGSRFADVGEATAGHNWAARYANTMAKVSDATMRVSLLSPWTDSGKKIFGMEFSSFIAEQSAKEWGRLNPKFRRALGRYGIAKDDWNVMRTTPMLEHKGVKFFRAEDVMTRADLPEQTRIDLVNKVQEMIQTEMDYAVPTPDARIRAITTGGGAQRGTILGEAARGVFMFKSFPMTVLASHAMRGAVLAGISNKAKYLGEIMIATTVLGALAMQVKDISRGRDARPMNDAKFLVAAMAQGGGAGILGDFMFSDQNRFGGSFTETLAGPMFQLASDTTRLTIGNVQQAIKGDDTHLTSELVDFMRGYTPGGSIWYTRLAFERGLIDQLDEAADAGQARKGWRRLMRTRQKDFGQGFWWAPGELAPSRAPDIGNVAGE